MTMRLSTATSRCCFNSFFSESIVVAFTKKPRKICCFSISPQSVIPNPAAPVSFRSFQKCVISSTVSVPVMANNAMGQGGCWLLKIDEKILQDICKTISKQLRPAIGHTVHIVNGDH